MLNDLAEKKSVMFQFGVCVIMDLFFLTVLWQTGPRVSDDWTVFKLLTKKSNAIGGLFPIELSFILK